MFIFGYFFYINVLFSIYYNCHIVTSLRGLITDIIRPVRRDNPIIFIFTFGLTLQQKMITFSSTTTTVTFTTYFIIFYLFLLAICGFLPLLPCYWHYLLIIFSYLLIFKKFLRVYYYFVVVIIIFFIFFEGSSLFGGLW